MIILWQRNILSVVTRLKMDIRKSIVAQCNPDMIQKVILQAW